MLKALTEDLVAFRDARGWAKYHTPENLAKAICIEAAELLECYQWGEELDSGNPEEEMADIMIYLLTLGHELGIDWVVAVHKKMTKNARKYPIERGVK